MATLTIQYNGKTASIERGFQGVTELYNQLNLDSASKRLYLDIDGEVDIPLLPGDYMIFRGNERIIVGDVSAGIGDNPTLRNPLRIKFNNTEITFDKSRISAQALAECDKEFEAVLLFADIDNQPDERLDAHVWLVLQASDSFITVPDSSGEGIVDLSECAKHGRRPPKLREGYRIAIDGGKYFVRATSLTGAEIMALVDKSATDWALNQKLHGGKRVPIEPDEAVDLTQPGIERFETVRKTAQQGR